MHIYVCTCTCVYTCIYIYIYYLFIYIHLRLLNVCWTDQGLGVRLRFEKQYPSIRDEGLGFGFRV